MTVSFAGWHVTLMVGRSAVAGALLLAALSTRVAAQPAAAVSIPDGGLVVTAPAASQTAPLPEPAGTPPSSPPSSSLPPSSSSPPAAGTAGTLAIHGFVGQGFMVSTGNEYIVPDTKHGSFQLSEVGLNITKEIGDKLRLGIQAFAQNFALGGNFKFQADWFYLDYRWKDWMGLRVGRLKIPFGLYNEIMDIDAARVPILLPQSLYPVQGRSFLFAQTGAELYGFARSRAAGALEYRLYLGTVFIDPAILTPAGSALDLQLNVRYVAGGRLFWETPVEGLRVGVSALAIRLDVNAFSGGMVLGSIVNHSYEVIGSAEYARGDLVLTAEYSRGHTDQDSLLEGSDFTMTAEHAYAMSTYRITNWLQPGAYYSLLVPNVDKRDGSPGARQDDIAVTLRFDVTANWIFKAEGHYMNGTAGLVAPLTISPPPVDPDRHWGVFLLKSTGYF